MCTNVILYSRKNALGPKKEKKRTKIIGNKEKERLCKFDLLHRSKIGKNTQKERRKKTKKNGKYLYSREFAISLTV
jgi:hypothetical protein